MATLPTEPPTPRYHVEYRPDLAGKPCAYNYRTWGPWVVIDGRWDSVHSGWQDCRSAHVTMLQAERGQLIEEEMP